MQAGEPSRTAWAAAFHRAAHQVLEEGRIFADPLALRILSEDAARQVEERASDRRMRIFIAVRTRFAEDSLAAACERGLRQLVVLGAGLDTYAYRGACRERLRIFEVDYPATQAWKRERLERAAIPLPSFLTFAPVDFERESLAHGLNAAGFDPARPSFFIWLGTVPYLTDAAIFATLGFVASLPDGSEIVFDYSEPIDRIADPKARAFREQLAIRTAAAGEPILSHFEPERLRDRLLDAGFGTVENLGAAEITQRFQHMLGGPWRGGGNVMRAATR